jgi:branched-subunit amino acid aminotransferase/4-amino-4-deoxychorismate lyase
MAITLETVTRNAACNAEVDLVDAGGGAGYVTICTSADAVLVTLPFGATAFGAANTGVATANAIAGVAAAASGTAAKYKVYDYANVLLWGGTVGTTGTDMDVPTTTVTEGVTFTISSFTHTVPATTA